MSSISIKRALIAVYDKTGIADFARALVDEFGVEIISTGGTARHLKEAGIPVTMVEEVTGFPEMLDGRVKTLHPKIHAGILADRDNPEHMRQLAEHGIRPIDMVVVNLYPFEKTVKDPNCKFEDAIEMIDIGGPCMLRAAAKNHRHVVVVDDTISYGFVIDYMRGKCIDARRREFASGAFDTTCRYDVAVSTWMDRLNDGSPMWRRLCFLNRGSLRYGENPHQSAELLADGNPSGRPDLTTADANFIDENEKPPTTQLSFNNYVDANAALRTCAEIHRELRLPIAGQHDAASDNEPRASARAVDRSPAASDFLSPFAAPDSRAPAWLLTWTTYGSWLPGDVRGYVSRSPRNEGGKRPRNQPGTDYDVTQGDVENAARHRMKGNATRLTPDQARLAFDAMIETAANHDIAILAMSVMPDHVHVLCQADKDGGELLQLFKGGSSRILSKEFTLDEGSRWWTKSGSKRVIQAGDELRPAIEYVRKQRGAFVARRFDEVGADTQAKIRSTAQAEARGSSRPGADQSVRNVCVFIKHTNACGVGIADDPVEAYRRAYLGDPNAAMGGILAVNFDIDAEFAEMIMGTLQRFKDDAIAAGCASPPQAFFAEVIVAPSIDEGAVEVIRTRKKWGERVRLLEVGDMNAPPLDSDLDYKRIAGGMLAQTPDLIGLNEADWKIATNRQPADDEMADLRLAWLTCKHTKSNAITICRDGMLIGNGAGQMSRVMSCRIATWLAKENGHAAKLAGAAAASDAFFPFRDGLDILADAGVTAVIQPGGSKCDDEVIAAANERGIAMILTGTRHFKH